MRYSLTVLTGLLLIYAVGAFAQNKREDAVRADKKKIEADESWIYNDLNDARAQAKAENKPVMVLIRCIP